MSNLNTPGHAPRMLMPRLLVGAGLLLALAGGLLLWARFGASVFYEIIASGLIACF